MNQSNAAEPTAGAGLVEALRNWRHGRGPLWMRLADEVEHAIDRGDLTEGDRLPSERYLSEELEVGRSTVTRAMSALAQRGAVTREQGSGTFVSATAKPSPLRAKGPWPLSAYHRTTDRVPVGLGAAVHATPAGLPEELLRLDHQDFTNLGNGQSSYALAGLPSMREVVAQMLRDTGVPATAEGVVITTGASQSMSLLIELLLRPDDTVIVDRRAYPGTLALLRRAGVRVIAAPEGRAGNSDVEAVVRYARQHMAAAVIVQSTCNAATGSSLSEGAVRRLADLAAAGVAIVDDRALADYHPDPPPSLAAVSQHRNIFTLGSFNKIYWGGLRLGWAYVRESLVPQLLRAKAASDSGASVPSQLIAQKLHHNHGEVVARRRAAVEDTRKTATDLLARELSDWQIESAPFGPAMWVRLPVRDTGQFVEHAFEQGSIVGYGGDYRADGRPSSHIRLSLTNDPDTTQQLLCDLAAAWASYEVSESPWD